jgi:ribosomal protein S18 acetylase RimI-like enzyme
MIEIEIRDARPEDVPAAARLAAELVRLHHRFDPLRFMRVEPLEEGYARYLRGLVGGRDTLFLVAASGDGVVGYALAGLEGRDWMDLRDACGKLYDLYVDPRARRSGIATLLAEAAIARLEALGVPRVVLMTAAANAPAQRLFERLGFRPTMIEMTREAPGGASPGSPGSGRA